MAVIVVLGIVTIGCAGGIIWLASTSTQIPSALEVLAGTALGGVTGLLVSTKANPDQPVPPAVVQVPPTAPPFPGDQPVA